MSDILQYIIEHPFYCLLLLAVVIFAFVLAPYSNSANESKRRALIEEHYRETFKK